MKEILIFLTVLTVINTSCNQTMKEQQLSDNPFFVPYNTPYDIPAFDRIRAEHFMPAVQEGIKEHTEEIEKIISNPETPSFSNTIEALDASGSQLNRATNVFYNLLSANTSPELQQLAKELSPLLSSHEDYIWMNEELFARVRAINSNKEELGLDQEQTMLLEKFYERFERYGASLSEDKKQELKKINEELSLLGLQFGDNLLAEDNEWKLVLEKEEDLAGLPDMIRSSMASDAEEAGLKGKWIVTLHKPSWIPFLQYSSRRDLREKVFLAWMNRGNNDNKNDNKEIIKKTIQLRDKKAEILGYDNWASYILDKNMAKTPEAVYQLLNGLWEKALPVAKAEAAAMQEMIKEEGEHFQLAPWDWWYYAEKVRKARYDLDDEELRPYFELESVLEGLFYVVNRLYGLKFEERADLPKPHPDTRSFEVLNPDGSHLGILFMDFHPRSSKSGGAWMNSYRKQHRKNGKNITPIITTVFNFTKPAGNKPALLTFDETSTMFHEMGHALHGLLSDCTYKTISGTSVPRDFVELPSQILENWASEPEVLKIYAKHYETGETIPDELIEKLNTSSKFNQGFATVEYLAASLLDMAYHTTEKEDIPDPLIFEQEAMSEIGLIDEIIPRYRSTFFAHIFEGEGYSSGYYSYKWAEVLDADAFEAFKESGDIFNPEIATSFRDNILSKGGSDEAMDLYIKFRGKEPELDPLLKRSGLL